jgi:hypothetical protein
VRKRFIIKVGADLQPLTTHRDCKVLKLEGLKTKPAGRAEGVYESDQKKTLGGRLCRKKSGSVAAALQKKAD